MLIVVNLESNIYIAEVQQLSSNETHFQNVWLAYLEFLQGVTCHTFYCTWIFYVASYINMGEIRKSESFEFLLVVTVLFYTCAILSSHTFFLWFSQSCVWFSHSCVWFRQKIKFWKILSNLRIKMQINRDIRKNRNTTKISYARVWFRHFQT
jgi:hypothetical protein